MRPPRTAIVTFNLVAWDGRAQKVARSLAEAGWDAWLVGGSETGRRETSTLGRAHVVKLPGRIAAEGWRRRHLTEFEGEGESSDVRTECGLGPDVALLVYPGAVGPARGLATVVAALPKLEDVHFALQVISRHRYVLELEQQAGDC